MLDLLSLCRSGSRLAHSARLSQPLAVWQLVAWGFDTVLFPGPLQTARAIIENFPTIASELGNTLRRAFTAFGLSVMVMVPLGIACGRLRRLGLIVDPILEFLVTIPPPAIIPIVMILAGVGDVAKIAVISYAMIPNILVNTIETVRQSPPMLNRVGRSLRVHLLLATQSLNTGGARIDKLEPNLTYRIALRTTSSAESKAVIGTPEAQYITNKESGVGFLRVGMEDPVKFASVYTGATYVPTKAEAEDGDDSQRVIAQNTFRIRPFTAAPMADSGAQR